MDTFCVLAPLLTTDLELVRQIIQSAYCKLQLFRNVQTFGFKPFC